MHNAELAQRASECNLRIVHGGEATFVIRRRSRNALTRAWRCALRGRARGRSRPRAASASSCRKRRDAMSRWTPFHRKRRGAPNLGSSKSRAELGAAASGSDCAPTSSGNGGSGRVDGASLRPRMPRQLGRLGAKSEERARDALVPSLLGCETADGPTYAFRAGGTLRLEATGAVEVIAT
eukprot:208276-Pleurochrysis_carterae.AAC.3